MIQGARMAGASRIIAVDINTDKFGIAKELGATDCVDPTSLGDVSIAKHIAGTMTDWGVDYSFDCTGNGTCQNIFRTIYLRFSTHSRQHLTIF